MERIIFVISFLAIVGVSTAASIESPDILEGSIEARALNLGVVGNSGLAAKVLCVTDTIERVVNEYHTQSVWQNVEQKLQTGVGNLFLCLKYQGFQVQA